jgi:hypothetical protein
MDDVPPRIDKHEAADRFGKTTLRTAHDLTAALADGDDVVAEPIVLRRGGPHRSIDGLMALLDDALADESAAEGTRRTRHDDATTEPPA